MPALPGQLPPTRRGDLTLSRRVLPQPDGSVALLQSFAGDDTRTLITHRGWLVARVEVEAGALSFPLAGGERWAPARFVLALPPGAALPLRFHGATVRSEGVGGRAALPGLAGGPRLLEAAGPPPLDLASAAAALRAPARVALDADAGVDPRVAQARWHLHSLLARPAPVRAAARAVGLPPETLCRQFVRAYHLGPKAYCHRARLFEAVLRLCAGAGVMDAALAAGFGDLSRFYAQFRRLLGATPGAYARIRKRQAPAG